MLRHSLQAQMVCAAPTESSVQDRGTTVLNVFALQGRNPMAMMDGLSWLKNP